MGTSPGAVRCFNSLSKAKTKAIEISRTMNQELDSPWWDGQSLTVSGNATRTKLKGIAGLGGGNGLMFDFFLRAYTGELIKTTPPE